MVVSVVVSLAHALLRICVLAAATAAATFLIKRFLDTHLGSQEMHTLLAILNHYHLRLLLGTLLRRSGRSIFAKAILAHRDRALGLRRMGARGESDGRAHGIDTDSSIAIQRGVQVPTLLLVALNHCCLLAHVRREIPSLVRWHRLLLSCLITITHI